MSGEQGDKNINNMESVDILMALKEDSLLLLSSLSSSEVEENNAGDTHTAPAKINSCKTSIDRCVHEDKPDNYRDNCNNSRMIDETKTNPVLNKTVVVSINEINDKDVVILEGSNPKSTRHHKGNIVYLKIVAENGHLYNRATSNSERNKIKQSIFDTINKTGGRFLQRNNDTSDFTVLCIDKAKEIITRRFHHDNHDKGDSQWKEVRMEGSHSCKNDFDRRVHEDDPNNCRDNNGDRMIDEAKTKPVLDGTIVDTNEINDNDVVIMQGSHGNRFRNHKGNIAYWNLVSENSHLYYGANSTSKRNEVKKFIFDTIHKTGGRFLENNSNSSSCTILSVDEAKTKITHRFYHDNRNNKDNKDKSDIRKETWKEVSKKADTFYQQAKSQIEVCGKGHVKFELIVDRLVKHFNGRYSESDILRVVGKSGINTRMRYTKATKKLELDELPPQKLSLNPAIVSPMATMKTTGATTIATIAGTMQNTAPLFSHQSHTLSNNKEECNEAINPSSLLTASPIITTPTTTTTATNTYTTVVGPIQSTVSTIVNKNNHIIITETKENYDNSKKPEDLVSASTAASTAASTTASTDNAVDDAVNIAVDDNVASINDEGTNKAYIYNPGPMRIGSSMEEIISIFVPPGKLGFVVHISPDVEIPPIVRSIKDTSSLAGRVQVGDKLVAVDNKDSRTMTGKYLFKLFDPNSVNQASRKLTLLRTATASIISPNNKNKTSSNRFGGRIKGNTRSKEERRPETSGAEITKKSIEVQKVLKEPVVSKSTIDTYVSKTNPTKSSFIEKERGQKKSTQGSTKMGRTRGVLKAKLKSPNRGLQKFKRSARINSNTFKTISNKSKKRNLCQQEAENESKKIKCHQPTAAPSDFVEGQKITRSNLHISMGNGSGDQKLENLKTVTTGPRNRNNGDDDGYESWTEGSWCLLLPYVNKNVQAKSTTKVIAHQIGDEELIEFASQPSTQKLQLGDRKSIRIVTKRSLLDTGGNYKDSVSKKQDTSIKSKSQQNLMLENQKKKKMPTTTCTVVERQINTTNTPSLAPQQNDKNIMAIMIKEPHRNDILLGRGRTDHFGNSFYRSLIEKHYANYVKCTSSLQKANIKQTILDEILNTNNPPGRFLKRKAKSKLWTEISPKEAGVKLQGDLYVRKYNQQQNNDSSNESLHIVQQNTSALSTNDSKSNISNNTGEAKKLEASGSNCIFNNALQEARVYMLTKYGKEHVAQNEEKEIMMV